jgi:tRNA threonylcarbamoyladenosine biosynthesis protein TsaB
VKLLALDTASAQCSVALLHGDQVISKELATARDHAHLILPMVDAVLAEAGLALRQLDGIAFGRGPGSFTGVRVAAAVTQGLAAGCDLPVLPVSDLRALALRAMQSLPLVELDGATANVLACMDARMGEVYWAVYCIGPTSLGSSVTDELVSSPEMVISLCPPCRAGAGRGLAAAPQIAQFLHLPAVATLADAEPHAREIAQLAAADLSTGAVWLDAALAQPVYVRNQVAIAKIQG